MKKIEGVTPELFVKLKTLIRVEPFREVSSVQERIEQVYFRIDDWSSNEGTNDALIDLWIERVVEPLNVNTASYDELINLQNVSPVDVVSIINFREETGGIQSVRDMRGIPGLSYYGYSNARNFVQFSESDEEKGFHGHLTMRIDNTPFVTEEAEASQEVNLGNFSSTNVFVQAPNVLPNQFFKGRFTYNNYKFGFAYNRYLGEPLYYAYDKGIKVPEMKWFAGYENLDLGPLEVRKVYAGNYSLTFGQGVIMENTDFFTPRKSGFGFRKRFKGLTGDNSRTRQYSLRGLAAAAQRPGSAGRSRLCPAWPP